jgi:hypothetical protein
MEEVRGSIPLSSTPGQRHFPSRSGGAFVAFGRDPGRDSVAGRARARLTTVRAPLAELDQLGVVVIPIGL